MSVSDNPTLNDFSVILKDHVDQLVGAEQFGNKLNIPQQINSANTRNDLNTIAEKFGYTQDEVQALIEAAKVRNIAVASGNDASGIANNVTEVLTGANYNQIPSNIAFSNVLNTIGKASNVTKLSDADTIKNYSNLQPTISKELSKLGVNISDIPIDKNYAKAVSERVNSFKNVDTGEFNFPKIIESNDVKLTDEQKTILQKGADVKGGIGSYILMPDIAKASGMNIGEITTTDYKSNPSLNVTNLGTNMNTTGTTGDTLGTRTVDQKGMTIDPVTGLPVPTLTSTSYDPEAYVGMEKTVNGSTATTIDPTTGKAIGVSPRYKYGNIENFFQGKTESEIIGFKKMLSWGGAYGTSDIAALNGNITDKDVAALQWSMEYANRNGMSIEDAMRPRMEQGLFEGRPYGDAAVDINGDGKVDADTVSALKKTFQDNGLNASDEYFTNYATAIKNGTMTYGEADKQIREKLIANAFPAYKEEILAGQNIKDLASPYMETIKSKLGLTDITLDDPLIKNALSATDENGKPSYKSVYQLEQDIRKDARWQNTEEASKEYANSALDVLKTFGIIG